MQYSSLEVTRVQPKEALWSVKALIMRPQLMHSSQSQGFFTNITIQVIGNWDFFQLLVTFSGVRNPDNQGLAVAEIFTGKPSNIAILLKIIKDNQNIDNISIIKNNKGYFK